MRTTTAVIYLCSAADPVSHQLLGELCRRRAEAEGLTATEVIVKGESVTEVIADTDEFVPLADRPGWQDVVGRAAAGAIGAVVTSSRLMLGQDRAAWQRGEAALAVHGVRLMTLRTATAVVPLAGGRP